MYRAHSLDALRGYAILTMILSATIAFGILPGWMYHAQTPPPTHAFTPEVPGLTWVDLVFPFFLFSMGAAFPFSIGAKVEKGESRLRLAVDCVLRGAKLAYFAIFLQHVYPWVTASPQTPRAWFIALAAFLLLFPTFMRWPYPLKQWVRVAIELAAYAVGVTMMLTIDYADGAVFSLYRSNIIILLLADMAFFGGLIYLLTVGRPIVRLSVLPFVMAVFLCSTIEGSWQKWLYDFTPFAWLYKFYYLKYLFIVLIGSVVGEYLRRWSIERKAEEAEGYQLPAEAGRHALLAVLSLTVIVMNLYCLYTRALVAGFILSAVLAVALCLLTRGSDAFARYWHKLARAGAYLLLLGLTFEAYEGGIHKDPSSYSYYFVTSGMACYALLLLSIAVDRYRFKLFSPLEGVGQNPMIAYVSTSLVVMPLLNLLGLAPLLSYLTANPWLGFLQGVILTTLALCVALFFTRIKWFWRT